jgi:hypothetical protein
MNQRHFVYYRTEEQKCFELRKMSIRSISCLSVDPRRTFKLEVNGKVALLQREENQWETISK